MTNAGSQQIYIVQPQAIDLFAGCGGISLGLERAGFKVILANEVNEGAAKTYIHNFPHVNFVQADVRNLDLEQLKSSLNGTTIDVIAAGLPCQGFSLAGERNPRDPRNRLFQEMLRFVTVFKPRIVVIENVKGMLSMKNGRVVQEIKKSLEKLGYHVYVRTLVASDYGVPQKRERVFIIGATEDIPEQKLFPPMIEKEVTVSDAISDLAFLGINEKAASYQSPPSTEYQMLMRKNALALHNHESPNHSKKIQRRFSLIPQGKNGKDFLKRLGISKHTYFKLDPSKTSRTVTTLPEDFIHYSQNRIPTVREMARLQSFPDDFVFCSKRTTGGKRRKEECPQYTQVGNALPPLLAEAVFRNLASVLSDYRAGDLQDGKTSTSLVSGSSSSN